jgi:molybdenum cofactor cytidylyltransferase
LKPALVLLAAGESSRLRQCKALVRLGPRLAIEHLLAAAAGVDEHEPLVVTGADHAAIAAVLPPGVQVVENPLWRQGRTGSVAAAVRARPGLDLVIAPVDTPLVPREVFDRLLSAWAAAGSPDQGWLAPYCGEPRRYGHPVIAGRRLAREVHVLSPDTPLRALREKARPLLGTEVSSREILDDLDTAQDLASLQSRFRNPDR